MKLEYNLENIGNIDKASIIIKPLTIIAGENSTGKTFVTKSLYTILSQIYYINYEIAIQDKSVLMGMMLNLDTAFKKNFQITNLQSLVKNSNNNPIFLNLFDICNVVINNNNIKISLNKNIKKLKVSNVIFFDSPVYIKIRKALEKKPLPRLNYNGHQYVDKYLKGYPEYIDDLYHDLDLEYIDTADFDEISQEIQKIISGKLNVSRSGDIHYTDNQNNTIPLSLTAMGISNIGLIDLLLRNNVINKGSFLIMDEPEVHLHPEWQVILAQLLYKIAKNGANIIIATHSLDFLKAFENILRKENEIAEDIIAINKMPYDENFSEKTELEKVRVVLDDLSRPFYNLYMQDF